MGIHRIKHYDVEIVMCDNTILFEYGVSVYPSNKISNGHYVRELDDGSVEMINMSRIAKITFTAVHHPE